MPTKTILVSGLKWNTLASLINTITKLGKIAILSRLLTPADFGIMGMISVVIGFSHPFSTAGISNAIIFKQSSDNLQLSSLFWLNIFAGVVVSFALFISRSYIANFYNEPIITSYLIPIAIVFLLMPVGYIYKSLLQKELRFSILSKIETCAASIDFLLAIILAYYGFGVKALIIGFIGGNTFSTFCFFLIGWKDFKPSFYFNFAGIKSHFQFSIYNLGDQTVNYISSNLDYLIIGKFLGKEALGIYTIAFQIISIPWTYIVPIFSKVMFPFFAKVQDDSEKLKAGFLKLTKLLSYSIFPLLAGIAITSPLFVPLIFGDEWIQSIIVVQILTILGILKVLISPIWTVFLAKGKADLGFYFNIFMSILNAIAFILVVDTGIESVSIIYVALTSIYFYFNIILLKKIINLSFVPYAGVLIKPLLFSLIMIISLLVTKKVLEVTGVENYLQLIIMPLVGAGIYFIQVILYDNSYVTELKNLILNRS